MKKTTFACNLLLDCVRTSNILEFTYSVRCQEYTSGDTDGLCHSNLPFFEDRAMADSNQLTPRQREIYDFIKDKIESRGYGPTVREIGDGFGIESPNGVMCHLKAL